MSVTLRARQTGLLVRPLARAVPWMPVLGAAALSGLTVLPALLREPEPHSALWGLRIAAMLLGAAASFALADRMVPVAVAPTPRWLRQWLRTGLAVVPAATVWIGLYALVRAVLGAGSAAPGGELAVEAAVCGLTGLAGAAVAARVTAAGALTGPATQGALVLASLFLTGSLDPWQSPGSEHWTAVHVGWSALLPVIALALIIGNRE
jgi:hypothetical protein